MNDPLTDIYRYQTPKATAPTCTVKGCGSTARVTHDVYGFHCYSHAYELDEWSRFWQPIPTPPSSFDQDFTADPDTIMVTHPDTGGTKGQKLARFDLIPPDVLTNIAEHYGRGAQKYEDHNWARGYNWSLSYAALLRHLTAYWGGQDIDTETGSHHLDAVIFHAITLRAFATTHPELDDRWATTGGAA